MNVLGFDTSTAAVTAAVLRSDGAVFEHAQDVAALAGPPAHSRELMPAIFAALAAADLGIEEIAALAVGTGPGGFTGLRIGIATGRSLAFARDVAIHPVSSLDALAAGAEGRDRIALIDGRRGEVFATRHDPEGQRVWGPAAMTPEALVARLEDEPAADSHPFLALGDGSLRFRDTLERAGVEVAPDDAKLHLVHAGNVCRLAASAPAKDPFEVVPDYVRSPDAKPPR